MDALTNLLMQTLSGGGLSQISQQIGADESTTGSALGAAVPLLVSALANNASNPQGAQSLQQALVEDHDGSILSNLGGFLANPQAANGQGILGHVLGGQQQAVTQGLAQNTGLQPNQMGQLLQIAAPLLMGALGQQQQQQGFSTGGLASFLGQQQQVVAQENPNLLSMLNVMLDTNKSGSALDEIFGFVKKLLGGRR
ncbi:MAG: DUF937 domain-containing protein [Chloroflexi bacterium]|nr:DUF937 domain-containing protein [Chloroflexota bacterium]